MDGLNVGVIGAGTAGAAAVSELRDSASKPTSDARYRCGAQVPVRAPRVPSRSATRSHQSAAT